MDDCTLEAERKLWKRVLREPEPDNKYVEKDLISLEFCRSFLAASSFIELSNEAICTRYHFSGASRHIISEKALLKSILPFCKEYCVQKTACGNF